MVSLVVGLLSEAASLVGIVLLSSLTIHLLYCWYRSNFRANSKERDHIDNVTIYLMIGALLSMLLSCISFGILRYNFLLPVHMLPPCYLTHASSYIFAALGSVLVEQLFLYRVYTMFRGTTMGYSKTKLIIFGILMAAFLIFYATAAVVLQNGYNFAYFYPSHKYKLCRGSQSSPKKTLILATVPLRQFIVGFGLLYMFISRLRILYKQLDDQFQQEFGRASRDTGRQLSAHSKPEPVNIPPSSPDTSHDPDTEDGSELTADNTFHSQMSDRSNSARLTRSVSYSERLSYDRIAKITGVMKKTTLLMSATIISAFIVYGASVVYFGATTLVPYDLIVNGVCAWLTFRYNDGIWRTIDRCCCRCNACCPSPSIVTKRLKKKFGVPSKTKTNNDKNNINDNTVPMERKGTIESESGSTTYVQMSSQKQNVSIQPTINEAPNEDHDNEDNADNGTIDHSSNDIAMNSPVSPPMTPIMSSH